jgi:hypothetical protein
MRTLFAFAGLLLLCGPANAGQTFPNGFMTPGVPNPDVTQSNIKQTICKSGWTKKIRPSTSYTNKLKQEQIAQYGYSDKRLSSYEEDHLISLQLGGHPKDPGNLWPEAYAEPCGARRKDVIETKLKRLVCSGKISLAEAQQAIASNWVVAYNQYVKPLTCP